MTQILASIYLGPPGASFWRWSDDEQAVVWVDGPTIAVRRELEEVLARLAPQGLPSLSAVVLVLAACREGWEEGGKPAFERLRQAALVEPAPLPAVLERRLRAARHALQQVTTLPPGLRQGPDMKAALVELVLDAAPKDLDAQESAAVLLALREEHVSPASSFPAAGLDELLKDLEVVARGAAALDPERLELRARTGLEALPAPAEAPLPDQERVRLLLGQLLEDKELSGVARLARDLLAAVHVPRRLSERDDQPLGGVSDLVNRGPPERLLLSELAHDDLTLAVRMALGEALYLRREAPPRQPAGLRALLVDCGIRLWGAPRLFATAVALAFAAEAGPKTTVRAWRPARSGVQPVDLTTRAGLVEHLEVLEPGPHPGPSLQALLARLEQERTPNEDQPVELVLVTHAAVLDDPAFLQQLPLAADRPILAATVDGEGRYRLQALGRRGRRLLGSATLSLETLHPAPPAAPPLLAPTRDPELPALLREETVPFLLPHRIDPARAVHHPRHGLLCATRDGRLTRWELPGQGARQLTDRLPEGRLLWLELEEDGVARCLIDAASQGALLFAAAPGGEPVRRVRPFRPGEQGLLGACRLGSSLALVLTRAVHLIELESGATIATLRLPQGTLWGRDRFFQSKEGWLALRWDGSELALVPTGLPPRMLAVWEQRGVDGILFLEPSGAVSRLRGSREPERVFPAFERDGFEDQVSCQGVSADGRRVVLTPVGRTPTLVVLGEPGEQPASIAPLQPPDPVAALLPQTAIFAAGAPQLRKRMVAIGADEQGRLVLESRRGPAAPIVLDPDGSTLRIRPPEYGLRVLARARFEDHPGVPGTGYLLKVATWKDGSRAFLDGRGLLHLQSPRLPVELCLVLGDDAIAGWASNGLLCGSGYYLGEKTSPPARALHRHLASFAGGLP